jgi:LPXTG-motif cell wall-anchored protein
VEWESGEIRWYVDDILYHTATPTDVEPNEWVFEHPFYILLNLAVGGNFGGAVGANTGFPQEMLVDYVRVYQLPNASERFTASFVDGVTGWRQVNIAFSALERSENQPVGAPDDGLTLSEVWGYGFHLDTDATRAPDEATSHLDQVLLTPGAPTSVGLSALGQDSSQNTVLVVLGLIVLLGGLGLRRRRQLS